MKITGSKQQNIKFVAKIYLLSLFKFVGTKQKSYNKILRNTQYMGNCLLKGIYMIFRIFIFLQVTSQ